MTVELLPDVEALVSAYLRARSEITTLVAQRVYTALPSEPTWPLVRLTRIGGIPVMSRPLRLDAATIQVDCYGGPKALAWEIAETCRAVLAESDRAVHSEGYVTGVQFGPMNYLPDREYSPAKPRYTFDVDVFVHG